MAKGKCATGKISNPAALFAAASIGSTYTSLRLSPASSLKQGRRKVTATVTYASGVTVRATCDFDVDDEEAPTISLVTKSVGGACAWPRPGKAAACFLPKELVKVTDNCRPLPAPVFVGCEVTSNGAASDCYREAGKVCIKYPAANAAEPRVARVTFVAEDGTGNASPETPVILTAYGAKPGSAALGCRPK
ncbi:hypothetical protein MNEG_9588 [Monoraphidium neglectum]|jgi:hypothetical protein|uniref:Uncharacterized protein n=1 Tax=Monoraphidium neglectum TaxID=145388 RepID=A0A0D2KS15_9CHLO|nr:hypothetical protein MNEG_9588 [Monoraphidium neglectum]KIY98373.1 hypothetical protein MNEG_9588 [Monoraphidium neglectum]|eukprot:XP_013897393.1 hypothetical protein MNEG_9588 [Monoraphidium neglectum]